jgi:outer membrane protein assembly factor BamA
VPPFDGSYVPLSERFFSGGPDSLRGFAINAAGPQRPVTVCSNPSNPATCSLIIFFETESAQKATTIADTVPLIDTNDLYPILERYEIKLL